MNYAMCMHSLHAPLNAGLFLIVQVPQKPSSYVGNILRPLLGIKLPDQYRKEWSCNIIEAVSERYLGDSLLDYNILSMLSYAGGFPTPG